MSKRTSFRFDSKIVQKAEAQEDSDDSELSIKENTLVKREVQNSVKTELKKYPFFFEVKNRKERKVSEDSIATQLKIYMGKEEKSDTKKTIQKTVQKEVRQTSKEAVPSPEEVVFEGSVSKNFIELYKHLLEGKHNVDYKKSIYNSIDFTSMFPKSNLIVD
jgi:hypothetical protein